MPAEPQTLTAGSAAWSFLAGLGGAAIPLSVMWVKLRLDQLSARCDTFAKVVESATELSLEYWLLGVAPDASVPDPESEAATDHDATVLKHEIQLRGAQTTLQADVERMTRDLPMAFRTPLRDEFRELVRSLTGGKFGDRDGHVEPHKAQAVVASGARIIRVVRDGRDDVSRPWNMLRFLFGRL